VASLTDKYCIVGVGETAFMRDSGRTTLSLACEAIKNAAADAGLRLDDLDGVTSYNTNDSCVTAQVAHALGLKLNYGVDIYGGAGATEALIAQSIGLIEQGYARSMVLFRSMNGRSGNRKGGRSPAGGGSVVEARGRSQFTVPAGLHGAPCDYALYAARYLYEHGYDSDIFGHVAVTQRRHAQLNPKALRREPMTLEDHRSSRWIVKPLRLFDCCQEVDNAVALIIAPASWAQDLRQPPVYIRGGIGRAWSEMPDFEWSRKEILRSVGYRVRSRLFGQADIHPDDVDIFGMYDCFTPNPLYWWEAMGYCGTGEGGAFIEKGAAISIDGPYPQNLSGGQLSETYTHGFNLVTENVRQLRGRADDWCPGAAEGVHSFDREKGCRQAVARRDRVSSGSGPASGPRSGPAFPEISLNVGTGSPRYLSAVVLRR
jgi:acetyl-CoA acetyltransferase